MWELLGLLVLTYFTGSWVEKRHFKSIVSREQTAEKIPILADNIKGLGTEVESSRFVTGSAVVGSDFFKSKLSSLISIFGGRIAALESVMDRARREALLRMKDEASGADYICGVQFETCFINDSKSSQTIPVVEVLVFGSAIYLKKQSDNQIYTH